MKEIIITQGITIEELVNRLRTAAPPPGNGHQWKTILLEAVPKLTTKQAARLLGCSADYIRELEATGHLQKTDDSGVEKYAMKQVLQCLAEGRTGRKGAFNPNNI